MLLVKKIDLLVSVGLLKKYKRTFFLKNLKFNLKILSKTDGFLLFINFLSPEFFKLSPVLVNLINLFLNNFSSNYSFATVSVQEMFIKTSSKGYIFYFTDVIPLLFLIDFFLRLKLSFLVKGLFSLKLSKFISIFDLAQNFNSKLVLSSSNNKFKLQLVASFFNFYYPSLLKLLFLITFLIKK